MDDWSRSHVFWSEIYRTRFILLTRETENFVYQEKRIVGHVWTGFVYQNYIYFQQASQEYNSEIAKITLEGSTIEELELDFTLPGHEHIELKLDGSKLAVNLDNLEEYLDLVVAYHLQHGVEMQLRSFKEGFDSVFLMDNLSAFSVEELETLICGVDQAPWDVASGCNNFFD